MSDLINRKDAIDACHNWDDGENAYAYGDIVMERLQALPSAELKRMKGKWIRITQGAMPEQYMCPFCHRTVEAYGVEELLPIRYPYCHCGADMRGGREA